MKIITLVTLALLGSIVSKTIFNVSLDTVKIQIEANDGQPLKVTSSDHGDEIVAMIATYQIGEKTLTWTYCLNFNDVEYQFCRNSVNQYNTDMATFFGKTIEYHKYGDIGNFVIWTGVDTTVPTEQEFRENIGKMVNKFIDYEQDNNLVFLK
jgi:hypothetical protein